MKKISLSILFITISFFVFSQTNTKSILFDGVDDSISVPHNTILNPTTALTIQAWIKPSAFGTNVWDNYIVGKDDWSSSSAGYTLRCGASGKLSFNISSGNGAWKEVTSNTLMPLNTWTNVAGTFDGSVLKIYINGVLANSLNYSGTINPSNYNLNIGSVPYTIQGGRFFKGNIDQVEIWNIALSSTLINQYMNCPPVGNELGLIAFWNFEEGSGTNISDLTSYHNNGTLYNNPSWSADAKPVNCGSGINENKTETNISIFPNPFNDKFTINFSSFTPNDKFIIIDQTGRVILEDFINSNPVQINFKEYSEGMYFVKVIGKINNTFKIFKL